MDLVTPGDVEHRPHPAERARVEEVVGEDRRHGPAAIAENQPELFPGTVVPRRELGVAHEQGLLYLGSVGEFPDEHRGTKIEWRADGS
jgi:hypothetical protein